MKEKYLKQCNILYVEDDQVFAKYILEILKKEVKNVIHSPNGENLTNLIMINEIDIVILDIKLANISGIDLCKEINNLSREISIVLLSAYPKKEYLKDAIELGVDYFIEKPILNENELLSPLSNIASKIRIKRMEKRLEVLENTEKRLSAMDKMISNLAHQWRQPLNIISIIASALRYEKESRTISDETLAEIEKLDNIVLQTQELSKTLNSFNYFSELEKNKSEKIDLCFFIKENIKKLDKVLIDKDIEINFDCNVNQEVLISKNMLSYIFEVLINNSIDNFEKETIIVEQRYIFIDVTQEENSISISFVDNGGGVESKDLENIFDPYFSTKFNSYGIGLSLYTLYLVVKYGLNGNIDAYNKTFNKLDTYNCGLCYDITIPS